MSKDDIATELIKTMESINKQVQAERKERKEEKEQLLSLIKNLEEEIQKLKNDIKIKENEIENLKKENSSMDVVSEIEDLTKDMIMQIYCSFNEEGLGPIKWWK